MCGECLGLAVCGEGLVLAVCGEGLGLAVCSEGLGLSVCGEGLGLAVCGEGLGLAVCDEGLRLAVCSEFLGLDMCAEGLGLAVCGRGLGLSLWVRVRARANVFSYFPDVGYLEFYLDLLLGKNYVFYLFTHSLMIIGLTIFKYLLRKPNIMKLLACFEKKIYLCVLHPL